jgi:uncharacterized membrane protein
MSKLLRILKHRWLDERDAQRALGKGALARIEARVTAGETRHSGETRVCVEAGLPLSYLKKNLSARDRAVMMFAKLRVWDTEANNGVLIYLLLAERAIEIVADRGLARFVSPEQWQAIVGAMREPLAAGRFEEGLNDAIDAVDALLVQHFPLAAGASHHNELPDAPFVN